MWDTGDEVTVTNAMTSYYGPWVLHPELTYLPTPSKPASKQASKQAADSQSRGDIHHGRYATTSPASPTEPYVVHRRGHEGRGALLSGRVNHPHARMQTVR